MTIEPDILVNSGKVIDVIAEMHGVDAGDIIGPSRARRHAWPRQIAMYALRRFTALSTPQIGARLGYRDHSTVIHGAQHVAARIAVSPKVAAQWSLIERELCRHAVRADG